MAKTNPEALKKFFLRNPENKDLALSAFEELSPFLEKAKKGMYDLAPVNKISQHEVIQAIFQATGQETRKIIFVSLINPFPGPKRVIKEIDCHNLVGSLTHDFGKLWSYRWDNRSPWNFWDDLMGSFNYSFKNSLWDRFNYTLESTIWTSLFYFIYFALEGDKERTERLRPLIKLLPKTLVLGKKKDKSCTWFNLTA